uniref:Uncharacterized protein n=1 Tax=Tetranychus urticae TaxID=32264 RepID=T1JQR6_TETUR
MDVNKFSTLTFKTLKLKLIYGATNEFNDD